MNSSQKAIKYIATAFAVFLAVSIISSVIILAGRVLFSFNLLEKRAEHSNFGYFFSQNLQKSNVNKTFANIKRLDIDIAFAELKILQGDSFKVEAENVSQNFICKDEYDTLVIHEKAILRGGIFSLKDDSLPRIKVYLPSNFTAEQVSIKTGAGKTSAERLAAKQLDLSFGAGDVEFDSIIADEAEIDGGVGSVKINSCQISGLDFEAGVGETIIDGRLTGENKIKAGVGALVLNLQNSSDDYNLDIKSGVGEITIDGVKTEDVRYHNATAKNSLKIDGGVGSIAVNFKK
ncbi:MAG TPA: hypothetical protein DCP97_03705 [Ruminococcaceae bacterium]|nr:hypothetical protein [Oscillospiraceae bacterium]